MTEQNGSALRRTQDEPSDSQSLIIEIQSRDGGARKRAREALTRIGPHAVRALTPLLKTGDSEVRWEAAKALADIADPSSSPNLVAALEDDDGDVRWLAAVGLSAIGSAALVPLLFVLQERPESAMLREGAHHVLRGLATAEFKPVLNPVITALESADPEHGVRVSAEGALARVRVIRS